MSTNQVSRCLLIVLTSLTLLSLHSLLSPALAQESEETKNELAPHLAAFKDMMTDVTLTGHFTTLGQEVAADAKPESYEIVSAEKMIEKDLWMITAKIKYGGKDEIIVPVPVKVKFAGNDTPVITMTNFLIPTMGTFTARVLLYNGKYAGTWSAKVGGGKKAKDGIGGHMYGTLEPTEK